jgi:hypothetical protein
MPLELSLAGAAGLQALAAAKTGSAAAQMAAMHALALAKYSSIAATQTAKAQADLETYVHGAPVSSVPAVLSPLPEDHGVLPRLACPQMPAAGNMPNMPMMPPLGKMPMVPPLGNLPMVPPLGKMPMMPGKMPFGVARREMDVATVGGAVLGSGCVLISRKYSNFL